MLERCFGWQVVAVWWWDLRLAGCLPMRVRGIGVITCPASPERRHRQESHMTVTVNGLCCPGA